jgi:hypothetical protein
VCKFDKLAGTIEELLYTILTKVERGAGLFQLVCPNLAKLKTKNLQYYSLFLVTKNLAFEK